MSLKCAIIIFFKKKHWYLTCSCWCQGRTNEWIVATADFLHSSSITPNFQTWKSTFNNGMQSRHSREPNKKLQHELTWPRHCSWLLRSWPTNSQYVASIRVSCLPTSLNVIIFTVALNRTTTADIWTPSSRTSMTSSAAWSWPTTTAPTTVQILTKWSAAKTTATTATTCKGRTRCNPCRRRPFPDTCNCRVTWVDLFQRTRLNVNEPEHAHPLVFERSPSSKAGESVEDCKCHSGRLSCAIWCVRRGV